MTLRDRLDALAPREKRLLMVLAGVFGVLILAAIPFGVSALLSEAEATHSELVDALSRIETEGEAVRERQAERDAWKAEAEKSLQGLAAAVDRQFEAWQLTPAERSVALQLLKGASHREIAVRTARSERTIRQQAAAVYRKAGVEGRAGLAGWFLEGLPVPGGQMTPDPNPDG